MPDVRGIRSALAASSLLLLVACAPAGSAEPGTRTAGETGPAGRNSQEPEQNTAQPDESICGLVDEDVVAANYEATDVELDEIAGPAGFPSFDSCEISGGRDGVGSDAHAVIAVSILPMTVQDHDAIRQWHDDTGLSHPSEDVPGLGQAAFFIEGRFLQVYDDGAILRIEGDPAPAGQLEGFVALAEPALQRVAELPERPAEVTLPECDVVSADAVDALGQSAEIRRDQFHDGRLTCGWAVRDAALSASAFPDPHERERVWLLDTPGAESLDIGGQRENGVYLPPSGGVWLYMGDYAIGGRISYHLPEHHDRDGLIAFADTFARTLL